jgi:S1-C subfamily serine protease
VDSAVAGRKLERPWLGAKLVPVTRQLAEGLKLGRVAGALVARVYDRSPAADAGLQVGDVIIGVDGHEVDDARAVTYRLTTRGVGRTVRLDVMRDGRHVAVQLALRAPPRAGKDDVRDLSGRHPFDGARVANLLPSIAEELGIEDQEGVAVLSVRRGSTAARLGVQPGDVVVQVGGAAIGSVAELEAHLQTPQRLWRIVLRRGAQLLQLQVSG